MDATFQRESGDIEWRRPRSARVTAEERPSFLELLLPLAALAVGSVLAIGIVVALVFVLVSAL